MNLAQLHKAAELQKELEGYENMVYADLGYYVDEMIGKGFQPTLSDIICHSDNVSFTITTYCWGSDDETFHSVTHDYFINPPLYCGNLKVTQQEELTRLENERSEKEKQKRFDQLQKLKKEFENKN